MGSGVSYGQGANNSVAVGDVAQRQAEARGGESGERQARRVDGIVGEYTPVEIKDPRIDGGIAYGEDLVVSVDEKGLKIVTDREAVDGVQCVGRVDPHGKPVVVVAIEQPADLAHVGGVDNAHESYGAVGAVGQPGENVRISAEMHAAGCTAVFVEIAQDDKTIVGKAGVGGIAVGGKQTQLLWQIQLTADPAVDGLGKLVGRGVRLLRVSGF